MIKLTDDVWFIITPYYLAFVYSKDLDKFADSWEQSELTQARLLEITLHK